MARPPEYAGSLSFLLSQTGARSAQLFAERLAPMGVSPRAFGVLSNLAADEGQSQQQLADALGIHRNNMVGLVDEMEEAGWVERRRGRQDRRTFELHLTRAGSAILRRASAEIPSLDAELAAGLTAIDHRRLTALLGRVATGLGLAPGVHPHLAPARATGGRGSRS